MELTISDRIALVRENLQRVGGSRPVSLVAVAKTKPPEAVRAAIAAGADAIGENYVQELRDKVAAGAYEGGRIHMIGHLQTNKVKYIAGKVDLIQSVDSLSLLEAISRRALTLSTVQDILLEVNIGGEEAKSGLPPEELPELLSAAGQYPGIRVRGLMTIPPAENTSAYFPLMYNLFVDNKGKKYDNVNMDFLSMGMSDDYEIAVKEGANMVRVGSFIFGPRNYT